MVDATNFSNGGRSHLAWCKYCGRRLDGLDMLIGHGCKEVPDAAGQGESEADQGTT